jgi:hypothetical protein
VRVTFPLMILLAACVLVAALSGTWEATALFQKRLRICKPCACCARSAPNKKISGDERTGLTMGLTGAAQADYVRFQPGFI